MRGLFKLGGVEINLTVIGDKKCSTTLTYLTYLNRAGLVPKRLWLVDFGVCESPRWAFPRGLFSSLKRKITPSLSAAEANGEQQFHELGENLQTDAGFDVISHLSDWSPEQYASSVKEFSVHSFNDEYLRKLMVKHSDTAFLYTNGGIVPAGLLDEPEIKILHVHPGIVPQFRGSDCFLWSGYVSGKLGMSCFYMSAGLDEGEVLHKQEFPLPRLLSILPFLDESNEALAYRALLYFVDPHYRALTLVTTLSQNLNGDLRKLPSIPQKSTVEFPYLWMHPMVRLQILRDIFS